MNSKQNRIHLRAILTVDYYADPANYGDMTEPAEMAEEDEQVLNDDPSGLLDWGDVESSISVVVVDE